MLYEFRTYPCELYFKIQNMTQFLPHVQFIDPQLRGQLH